MTNSDLSLRLARPVEARDIACLSRDLIERGLPWRWTPPRVAASIRAPNVNVLVAYARENLVGFALMRYGDNDAHLDLLAVVPSYRLLGVGRRLLEWLEKCAVVAGIDKVTLEVRAANKGAQLFYQHMGYRIVTRIHGYYQGIEDALRMERILLCRSESEENSVATLLNLAKLLGPEFYHQTLWLTRSVGTKKIGS